MAQRSVRLCLCAPPTGQYTRASFIKLSYMTTVKAVCRQNRTTQPETKTTMSPLVGGSPNCLLCLQNRPFHEQGGTT